MSKVLYKLVYYIIELRESQLQVLTAHPVHRHEQGSSQLRQFSRHAFPAICTPHRVTKAHVLSRSRSGYDANRSFLAIVEVADVSYSRRRKKRNREAASRVLQQLYSTLHQSTVGGLTCFHNSAHRVNTVLCRYHGLLTSSNHDLLSKVFSTYSCMSS